MNFCEWILCLNNRNTPTGDLSRDIEQDQAIRSVPNARRDLLCYLESMVPATVPLLHLSLRGQVILHIAGVILRNKQNFSPLTPVCSAYGYF